MRLYINYKLKDSGKGKFLKMLTPRLEDLGVKCSFKSGKQDITLGVRRFRGKVAGPTILRVDGVYMFKDKKTYWTNNLVKKSIKLADGVIWQTQFCQDTVTKILGVKPKKSFVVFNGADPNNYENSKVLRYRLDRPLVVMSARWKDRPWKRLKDCLRVAREVRKHEDVAFWVAGKYKKDLSEKGIRFSGHLTEKQLRTLLAEADAMLNLSYYDWCPNAVVEALCAGVPVVCNNASGVREIIDPETCEVVNVDAKLVAKIRSHDNPPSIDPVPVAEAVLRVLHAGKRADCSRVHIERSALGYKNVFEEVLNAQ